MSPNIENHKPADIDTSTAAVAELIANRPEACLGCPLLETFKVLGRERDSLKVIEQTCLARITDMAAQRDAALERAEEAEKQLAYLADQHKRIVNEPCPTDEKHCTCVPILKGEIEQLRDRLATALKRAEEAEVALGSIDRQFHAANRERERMNQCLNLYKMLPSEYEQRIAELEGALKLAREIAPTAELRDRYDAALAGEGKESEKVRAAE